MFLRTSTVRRIIILYSFHNSIQYIRTHSTYLKNYNKKTTQIQFYGILFLNWITCDLPYGTVVNNFVDKVDVLIDKVDVLLTKLTF